MALARRIFIRESVFSGCGRSKATVAREMVTIDGNQAAAYVAHKTNEVIAIYPITPSSPMGEHADEWSAWGERNIWGTVPLVAEMQSEAGAAGAAHGALQAGSLTTTFTASQGLLLMIPNMYKIAGELTSTVFHIAARALATHALSIFLRPQRRHGDSRGTGWGMLVLQHAAGGDGHGPHRAGQPRWKRASPLCTCSTAFVPRMRCANSNNSREEDIRQMIDDELVRAHKARAMTPDRPHSARHGAKPGRLFPVQGNSQPVLSGHTGHRSQGDGSLCRPGGPSGINCTSIVGAPDAERVIVLMGSACETVARDRGISGGIAGKRWAWSKCACIAPSPWMISFSVLPPTTKSNRHPGSHQRRPGRPGEPLYVDVVTALNEGLASGTLPCQAPVRVIGGRYGLGSKEFIPGMVKAGLDELNKDLPPQPLYRGH
jgi:pyruvate-ferredoxin/flavodoxin oxidoreductase